MLFRHVMLATTINLYKYFYDFMMHLKDNIFLLCILHALPSRVITNNVLYIFPRRLNTTIIEHNKGQMSKNERKIHLIQL